MQSHVVVAEEAETILGVAAMNNSGKITLNYVSPDARFRGVSTALMQRLEAQARLIAAYEERRWPRQPVSTAELIRHLMDQHDVTRAEMVPILGTPSRVSEVLRGKKGLSIAMVQRLRARFRVPADLLIPAPRKASARRLMKRAAA